MGEETARQRVVNVGTGGTHLNPNTEKTLHDGVYPECGMIEIYMFEK